MQYKVESNVPLPAPDASKYPFASMQIGDSFLVPNPSDTDRKRVQTAAASYGRRHSKAFRTRSVDGGIRIWRVG